MRWYKRNPKKLVSETEGLYARYPGLAVSIRAKDYEVLPGVRLLREEIVVEGACTLDPEAEREGPKYEIAIVLPETYPRQAPILYCKDKALPRDIDRHILSDGSACLCVRSEFRHFLAKNYQLVDFVDQLVVPFLVGQFSYECNGKWPWKDRSHGEDGILEAWEDLLGFSEREKICAFLRALSRKNGYAGHLPCPCGSGQRLRHCHAALFRTLRDSVYWEDVRNDLALLGPMTRKLSYEAKSGYGNDCGIIGP